MQSYNSRGDDLSSYVRIFPCIDQGVCLSVCLVLSDRFLYFSLQFHLEH